jgi:hypothetical protein
MCADQLLFDEAGPEQAMGCYHQNLAKRYS